MIRVANSLQQVWGKYEEQIKEEFLEINPKLEGLDLTGEISLRILERSCRTNEKIDRLFLRTGRLEEVSVGERLVAELAMREEFGKGEEGGDDDGDDDVALEEAWRNIGKRHMAALGEVRRRVSERAIRTPAGATTRHFRITALRDSFSVASRSDALFV